MSYSTATTAETAVAAAAAVRCYRSRAAHFCRISVAGGRRTGYTGTESERERESEKERAPHEGMCHVLLLFMGKAFSNATAGGGGRRKAPASGVIADPEKTVVDMDELTRDVERLKAAMDERDRTVERLGRNVDEIRVSPLNIKVRTVYDEGIGLHRYCEYRTSNTAKWFGQPVPAVVQVYLSKLK